MSVEKLNPSIVERVTFKVWPSKPADYSLARAQDWFAANEAVYRAQRMKEYTEQQTRKAQ